MEELLGTVINDETDENDTRAILTTNEHGDIENAALSSIKMREWITNVRGVGSARLRRSSIVCPQIDSGSSEASKGASLAVNDAALDSDPVSISARSPIVESAWSLPEDYFDQVASAEPQKNPPSILRAAEWLSQRH